VPAGSGGAHAIQQQAEHVISIVCCTKQQPLDAPTAYVSLAPVPHQGMHHAPVSHSHLELVPSEKLSALSLTCDNFQVVIKVPHMEPQHLPGDVIAGITSVIGNQLG
jgi:hypothetical protein